MRVLKGGIAFCGWIVSLEVVGQPRLRIHQRLRASERQRVEVRTLPRFYRSQVNCIDRRNDFAEGVVREALGEIRDSGRILRLIAIVGMVRGSNLRSSTAAARRLLNACGGRAFRLSWPEPGSERTSGILLLCALAPIAANGIVALAAPIPLRKARRLCARVAAVGCLSEISLAIETPGRGGT